MGSTYNYSRNNQSIEISSKYCESLRGIDEGLTSPLIAGEV